VSGHTGDLSLSSQANFAVPAMSDGEDDYYDDDEYFYIDEGPVAEAVSLLASVCSICTAPTSCTHPPDL